MFRTIRRWVLGLLYGRFEQHCGRLETTEWVYQKGSLLWQCHLKG